MLKRDRKEIMNEIDHRIRNLMGGNGVYDQSGDNIYIPLRSPYSYQSIDGYSSYYPSCANGWPPQLVSYIQDVALVTALAIIDEILNEKEMEKRFNERAEKDLLQ